MDLQYMLGGAHASHLRRRARVRLLRRLLGWQKFRKFRTRKG
ncbi:hypothetical protein ES332_D11G216400v1 [Gossypium tomentosum]|uniref:Uncharacterized protein n=1 Tax=Gossypium tomentosum TaxID=34277 RepID=A0A5D2IQW2_GOSTO|nr:hypothetical protein ES332_D11G216400v1 [Gossypium tomentosum]